MWSDHKSLQHWYTEDLNHMIGAVGRRGRWHEFLSQFNLEVVYVPGKEHHVSDALSRWAYPAGLEADISFHGAAHSANYAAKCDEAEALYDDFPLRTLDAPSSAPYFFKFITRPTSVVEGDKINFSDQQAKLRCDCVGYSATNQFASVPQNLWLVPKCRNWHHSPSNELAIARLRFGFGGPLSCRRHGSHLPAGRSAAYSSGM